MKLHIKTLLVTALFAFASLYTNAQAKYEYLIIESNNAVNYVYVYKGGVEFKKIDFDKAELSKVGILNMALREVQKLEDDGWELFDTEIMPFGTNNAIMVHFYKFRKKRE